jgi:hypothetical protein
VSGPLRQYRGADTQATHQPIKQYKHESINDITLIQTGHCY